MCECDVGCLFINIYVFDRYNITTASVYIYMCMLMLIMIVALTLQGAKASECWDPESKGAEDYQGGHKLVIRQALLGPEAKEGEVNVVQVEAMTWKDSITIPVATLSAGPNGTSQCLLDLSFPDPPVTFSLLQGSGPVHIIGHHLIGSPMEEFDEIDEMEEEMLDEEEGEEAGVSVTYIRTYTHMYTCV